VHIKRSYKAYTIVSAYLLLSPSLWAQSATTNSEDVLSNSSSSLFASSAASAVQSTDVVVVIPPAYIQPSERQKLHDSAWNAFGPAAFGGSSIGAAIDQGFNSPYAWGQALGSYGRRVASGLGIRLVTVGTRYSLAEVFGEDIEYYRCSCRGFFRRFWHAAASSVTSRRGKDGHWFFSPALMVSLFRTATHTWLPSADAFAIGFRMGTQNLLGQLEQHEVLEFVHGGSHTLLGHIETRLSKRASRP
jgi:hypothetical protein